MYQVSRCHNFFIGIIYIAYYYNVFQNISIQIYLDRFIAFIKK